MKKTLLLSAILSLVLVSLASADVRLPKMFTSNCVLQRDASVNVFGWADAGEKVNVEFNGQKVETTACDAGKWCVQLAPMAAKCDGSALVVTGKNTVTVENVVVGEVWVCGGQSNMQYPVGGWDASMRPKKNCRRPQFHSFLRGPLRHKSGTAGRPRGGA